VFLLDHIFTGFGIEAGEDGW